MTNRTCTFRDDAISIRCPDMDISLRLVLRNTISNDYRANPDTLKRT